MSIMRCECCQRSVDTDIEDCTVRPVATCQEDWAFLCPECEELSEADAYIERMREISEARE